ncbi:hypothetical protein [Paraburkholderia caledonica]|uniref:hypothetical protein n=1 Tax=Paraburkholderia caledonica TaxID=134536 RepID=UPI00126020E6|nr:hypothetical protein [Paraburkholderia caledonica]
MTKKTIIPSLRAASLFSAVIAQIALANPVVCSPGYWDATCNPRINAGYQAAPTCSSDPGWTTVSPAQWQGSHFSSPQCNYQAPPSCPAGTTQSVAPAWNGAAWVGLSCQPNAPTITLPQIAAVCESTISAQMARAGFNGTNGTYRGMWGTFQGPYAVNPASPYPPQFSRGGFGLGGPGGDSGDFYYVNDLGNPPAGGASGGNGIGMCWFQSGTANLIGWGYATDQGSDGGGDGG